MRRSTYQNPDTLILASYVLQEMTPPGKVRSFLFRPADWDGKSYHVFITFTPAGIILQGPLISGPNGTGLLADRTFDWFTDVRTPEELLPEFLQIEWQAEVAARDLIVLASLVPDSKVAEKLVTLAKDVEMGELSPDGLVTQLRTLGFATTAHDIGRDYPVDDATWLCAIQLHFSNLIRFPN